MKVQTYDPNSLALIEDAVSGIDFGTVFQGNHCEETAVIRPQKTTETTLLSLNMYLQDQGGLTQSEFGYFQNNVLTGGIEPGSPLLSDNLTLDSAPHATGTGGVVFNAGTPEYLWLDIETGDQEKGTFTGINYRFVFEYN